jgi:hypothetical protein
MGRSFDSNNGKANVLLLSASASLVESYFSYQYFDTGTVDLFPLLNGYGKDIVYSGSTFGTSNGIVSVAAEAPGHWVGVSGI